MCTASHTSGAAFDASKWVKIAQKGADGSPSAGAVLYNGPQSLEAQSRRQAKVNIRTPECDYTYNTAAQQLTADHDGKLILVDADTVQTLPQGSTFPYGGAITLRSVNGIPFTVAAYGSDGINLAGPSVASFRVYPGGEARLYWTGFQWNGANLAPVAAALLNDRAQAFNLAEAQGNDRFSSRWRPALGWACVAAFIYQFLAAPMVTWLGAILGVMLGVAFPAPPTIVVSDFMPVLIGMLGLGVMRTYERTTGVPGAVPSPQPARR